MDEEKLRQNLNGLLFEIAAFDVDSLLSPTDSGLYNGFSGLSLFFYHMYLYTEEEEYYEKAKMLFEKAFEAIKMGNLNFSHGASGVMWLLNYYSSHAVFEPAFEETLVSFDHLVLDWVSDYKGEIDPMHGLLGVSHYLLSRPNPVASQSLERIITIVDECKVAVEGGFAWYGSQDGGNGAHDPYMSFGYAHGIPAILYFLSCFVARDIRPEKSLALLNGGISFMLAQQDRNHKCYFPSIISEKGVQWTDKMAFCYGDLGIACGLTAIGNRVNNRELLSTARDVAGNIAKISLKEIESINDIGLCHGAAGNGYMFMQLYKTHRLKVLEEAGLAQFAKLLSLKQEGTGIAGYSSIDYDPGRGHFYRKADPSFITGTTGVGLSIIALLSGDSIQAWNNILYLH